MCGNRLRLLTASLALAAAAFGGCATNSPAYRGQQTFRSPDAAAAALSDAAARGDAGAMEFILGAEAESVLSSGDPVADARDRAVFVAAMDQGWSTNRIDSRTRELVVGDEQWPFPIPLARDARGWWFDTAAGREEVLARRIGRNELAAIGTLQTYVVAQLEYASVGRDGRPAGVFAQRIRSDAGMHNGLFWPSDRANPSPLGELAAQAAAEGYTRSESGAPSPYRGYYFRILTRQGPSAPGGVMDYVVGGDMTGGFAMLAFPADYGNSGIMSFLVGPDGVIYEADLGKDTSTAAAAVQSFDPDDRWSVVQ